MWVCQAIRILNMVYLRWNLPDSLVKVKSTGFFHIKTIICPLLTDKYLKIDNLKKILISWFSSTLFFFLKFVLTFLVYLLFNTNVRISLSILMKIPAGILIEMESNLWIYLWRNDILTIPSFPIHEHSISLSLFRFSFIDFISTFQFSTHKSCTYFRLYLNF